MSALSDVRANLLAQISGQLPSVQVLGYPPAENQHLKESIWIDRAESEFEWRSLGRPATHGTRNRSERITIELRVHVYREAHDHTSAAEAAQARAEELLAEIEQALEADFSLGDSVTHALVIRWSVTPMPAEKGWVVDGRATVEAESFPT